MSNDSDFDLSETLVAKSDQLNADDLVGGPITVQILDAKKGDSIEQPVAYRLSGDHKPWKPCKTLRRILASITGSTMARAPVGRWVTLYRDPDVQWGGKASGGIRMESISGIDRPHSIVLAVNSKQKKEYRTLPLKPPADDRPAPPADPLADLAALLDSHGLTVADLDQQATDGGKPPPSTMDANGLARVVGYLRTEPGRAKLADLRASLDNGGGE
jgi:hypothetical protein